MRAAIVLIFCLGFLPHSLLAATLSWVSMPTDVTVELGGNALFTGEAESDVPPVHYQWLKDEIEISGATNSSLVISNVSYGVQSNAFSLVVSHPNDSIAQPLTSGRVYITIPQSPPVARYPGAYVRPAIAGTNLHLHTFVTGATPLYYQWFDGIRPIYGETRPFIEIKHNYSRGPIYPLVSNAYGVATGTVWNIDVLFPPELLRSDIQTNFAGISLALAPSNGLYTLRHAVTTQIPTPPIRSELARHDSNLVQQWSVKFESSRYAAARALVSDTNGNAFVWGDWANELKWGTNRYTASSALSRLFLAKVSSDSNVAWVQVIGEADTNKAIAMLHSTNDLWTLANSLVKFTNAAAPVGQRVISNLNVTLRQFDLDGNLLNAVVVTNLPVPPAFAAGTPIALHAEDFALLPDGFAVAGSVEARFGTNLSTYVYRTRPILTAYNADGTIRWCTDAGVRTNSNFRFNFESVAADGGGNIYVGATFYNSSQPLGWISKYDKDGAELWRFTIDLHSGGTGDSVLPKQIEILANGNIRVTGWSRGFSPMDMANEFFPTGAFVLELSPEGKLISPAIFRLTKDAINSSTAERAVSIDGRVYVTGMIGVETAAIKRSYLAELGYAAPRETTPVVSTHVVSPESGLTLRPNIYSAGPVAFEWQRDGQILGEENFASISLSPAELGRPAKYRLIVRNLGGAYTNEPISVGWARMQLDSANGVHLNVALPAGDPFGIEAKSELETAANWTSLTNTVSTGSTFTLELNPSDAQKIFHVIPQQ